jgi:hypothetical protein
LPITLADEAGRVVENKRRTLMEYSDFAVGARSSLHHCLLRLAGEPLVAETENAPIGRFIPPKSRDGEALALPAKDAALKGGATKAFLKNF